MTAVDSCALCQPRLETPLIRESGYWRIAVNRNQCLLGKTMIVLLRHEESLSGLSGEEWAELQAELGWLTDRLRVAFSPDHFNYAFLQNADRHVHLHVIPRYVDPRRFARQEFIDPDYPGHYTPGVDRRLDADGYAALAAALAG